MAPLDEQIVRPDLAVKDVEVAAVFMEDEGRPAIQIVSRHYRTQAAEAALRESEERLTLAFAGAQEGVWDWNLETGAVVYSPRWKQMLGYGDEEIEPHVSAWERLLHPDDRHAREQVHDSVARGEPTYEGEFRLRHKDGHYVHVLSRGLPVRREPDGPVVRIVGTHFDLTERKRAEAALRESEERLTLAFAGAQEGVWDWNLETGAVVYSPRWKEMLGYAEDEIEPHVSAWERLLHPDDWPRAGQVNESVARGEPTYEGEFRLRHKDGHYVHVLSRGFPVRREPADRSSGSWARTSIYRAQAAKSLELRVRERTAELRTANESLARRWPSASGPSARTELLARLVFAQEDERRRIAREMHDQFGEQLTALGRGISTLKDACADRARPRRPGRRARGGRAANRPRRRSARMGASPTALDDLGLRAALANYVQDWSKRVSISAELHTSGLLDDRLASETETTLYRIAQEALTNVAKHARAENVEVILERRADHVMLIVEDDGVGFDPGGASSARGVRPARHAGASRAGRSDARDRIGGRQGHDHSGADGAPATPAQTRR